MAPIRNGVVSSVARFWNTTNAPDYLGFIGLLVGWVLTALLVTPFHRMFFINDLHISFPHAEHERVSVGMNFVYALYVPLGILVLYNFIARSPAVKHEATYMPLAISICLTGFLTDIIKNAVGRPRPDLLARCKPASSTKPNYLVTFEICTAPNDNKLHDGWRSFPSGHSSFAFSGLGFLALFFAGQMRVFQHPSSGRDLSRALLSLTPLVGATLIAISRCEDYRHDVYDVTIGSALGMTIAYWSYRRYWPRLSSANCHEPYIHQSSDATRQGWQRVRDEETGGVDAGSDLALGPIRN